MFAGGKMSHYRVIAITTNLAKQVRETRLSPGYGHPVYEELATGYGPCRHCLRTFCVGQERRLLFTCDPFHGIAPFPLPGPVFIHAEDCPRYDEQAGFPPDLREHALTVVAYGAGREMISEKRIAGANEGLIEELLVNSAVHYLHVRDTQAGCYDFCISR
jgi:hypothetical protein